jgi:hypothetical protein
MSARRLTRPRSRRGPPFSTSEDAVYLFRGRVAGRDLSLRPRRPRPVRARTHSLLSAARRRSSQCCFDRVATASTSLLLLSSTDDAGEEGACCRNLERRLSPGGAGGRLRHVSAPARVCGSASSQSSRPALTCIIGARRAWIVPMISSASIPCRYTLVVETYECPSWRWITGSGTPSRASSTA